MREADAIEHLEHLMITIQKYRSNAFETDAYDSSQREVRRLHGERAEKTEEEFYGFLEPWLFGDKNVLPTLVKVLDQVREGMPLKVMDFYNFMVIADRCGPGLEIQRGFMQYPEWPEPSLDIIREWEPANGA